MKRISAVLAVLVGLFLIVAPSASAGTRIGGVQEIQSVSALGTCTLNQCGKVSNYQTSQSYVSIQNNYCGTTTQCGTLFNLQKGHYSQQYLPAFKDTDAFKIRVGCNGYSIYRGTGGNMVLGKHWPTGIWVKINDLTSVTLYLRCTSGGGGNAIIPQGTPLSQVEAFDKAASVN